MGPAMQAGGNQNRETFDRLAGLALHGIAGLEQQAAARFGQPALSVDPLFCDPPQRQPEHALLALLAAQPQPAAPLQVQHGESPNLANTEMGLEQLCGAEQLAAVVSQGGGHGSFPATEVLGVQHGGQPSPMERIVIRGLGG